MKTKLIVGLVIAVGILGFFMPKASTVDAQTRVDNTQQVQALPNSCKGGLVILNNLRATLKLVETQLGLGRSQRSNYLIAVGTSDSEFLAKLDTSVTELKTLSEQNDFDKPQQDVVLEILNQTEKFRADWSDIGGLLIKYDSYNALSAADQFEQNCS